MSWKMVVLAVASASVGLYACDSDRVVTDGAPPAFDAAGQGDLPQAKADSVPATPEAAYLGDRKADPCNGVQAVCKGQTAGCTLDEKHYIEGTFPGERKLLVQTTQGDWKIRVLLFLKEQLSPGTETEISWYEPGCTDEYRWKLSDHSIQGDLFEQAGQDQIFEVEHAVVESGDHLVTVWSDAVCRYYLRIEVLPQNS
jgi:hypothetical protein